MKLKLIAIICILTYGTVAFGDDCVQPVTSLTQGQTASCNGFLFSPAQEKKARLATQQLNLANEQLDIQNKQLSLYKDQNTMYQDIAKNSKAETEVWRNSAVDSSQKLIKVEESRGTRDVLLFLGGFAAAGFSAWLIHNALR